MPKNTSPRIIDQKRAGGSGYTFVSSGSGGGGVTDHGLLTGLADDDHSQYHTDARGDLRYVPLTRQVTGTGGVTGGGALSGDLSLALATGVAGDGLAWQSTGVLKVGAGAGIAVNADDVALATGVAGDGLAWQSTGVLKVGAGAGIAVNADDVALATSVAGDGLAWQSTGVLKVGAGDGLVAVANAINVGVSGLGLSVGADAVVLTSSSNPGAAAAILATDAAGKLQLVTTQVTGTIYADGTLDFGTDTMTEDGSYLYVSGSKPLNVGTNMLVVDGAASVVGVGVVPDGAATLDVQAKTNADHTVRIKQRASQTGRLWRIENTSGDELIVLDSVGNLQSGNPGFVSGLTGWQVTPAGNAEFNNIWARGELHASIFVMDEFHSNGGTFVTATAGKLENDAVLSATSDVATTNCRSTAFAETSISYRYNGTETGDNAARSIENWIEITDPPSGHAILFTPGQVLRCKTFTGSAVYDLWLRVNSSSDMSDYYRYHVQVMSGTYTTLPAGAAVIRYGKEGDGLILQTADLSYAPYLDIFTVGADVWSGGAGAIIPHVRLGRLDGVGLPGISGVEQYGMVTSTDLSDAAAPYFVASNTQIKQYRIDSTWNDGTNNTVRIESDGHVSIGTNVDTAAGVALDFDPLNGVLRVGNSTYGGQILIYGDGDGLTNIDGANIQTGTVTATQIAANTITASQIAANTITAGQIAANTITATQIAASTITATQIAASTITADRLNVSTLSAIVANLGSITSGSIVVGSTNKLWLNDSSDGALNIGGATKASAPFRVSSAGKLTATDVSITAGSVVMDSSGIAVTATSGWSIDRGYKFTYGTTAAAGLTATWVASPAKVASLSLWNNTIDDGSTAAISDADAYMRFRNVAATTKTAMSEMIAYHSGGSKTASLSLTASSSSAAVVIGGDSLLFNTYKIWHENNDGATSGLDADLLDGQHGTYYAAAASYAALAGATFSGYVTMPVAYLPSQASNPSTNPSADAACDIYMKGTKLVIGYNKSGTMYYITLELNSNTPGVVTWSRSSTAP